MAPSRVRIPPSPLARHRSRAHPRRGGRAVECGGLENRYPCKRIGGSNPLPSALAAETPGNRRVSAATRRPYSVPVRPPPFLPRGAPPPPPPATPAPPSPPRLGERRRPD